MELFAKRRRQRKISHMHALYEKLRAFREEWEANGGTRGSLRKARKAAHSLYPTQN